MKLVSTILPNRLKQPLRIAVNLATYSFGVYALGRDPLIPTRWLHSVGSSDFVKTGEEFARYFVELCGLRPEHRILDIGCGTGRMARPLTRYLTTGTYDGVDIVEPSIKWCQNAYSSYPNFKFHFSDVRNQTYNPAGKLDAAEYQFPFNAASFDFIFLTSVFTHMLSDGVQQYLSEISRLLKPGGCALVTYFLLNADSLQCIHEDKSSRVFPHEVNGAHVTDLDDPESAVAHSETSILDWHQSAGLLSSIKYGKWCGRPSGLSYQDIVIATVSA